MNNPQSESTIGVEIDKELDAELHPKESPVSQCNCASFFTVRGVHKNDCPSYVELKSPVSQSVEGKGNMFVCGEEGLDIIQNTPREEWKKEFIEKFAIKNDHETTLHAGDVLSSARLVIDFFQSTLTTLVNEMEGLKYTFKKVDWGDGIITDEPVEDDRVSLAEAKGFNAGISAAVEIIKKTI